MDRKQKREAAKKVLSRFKETGLEEDRQEVKKAIEGTELNELQRRVLNARYIDLKTYRQISEEEYRDTRWLQRVCNRGLEKFYNQNLTA